MADINQNFELFAGDSLIVQVTVSENLTGFSVKWGVSRVSTTNCFNSTPLLEKSSGAGQITIDDAINGIISFKLAKADTLDFNPANYYHQVLIIDGLGNEKVVTIGTMEILRRLNNVA